MLLASKKARLSETERLFLSENFKDLTSNKSIEHHQLVEKCNSLDVSTSCAVQLIHFN